MAIQETKLELITTNVCYYLWGSELKIVIGFSLRRKVIVKRYANVHILFHHSSSTTAAPLSLVILKAAYAFYHSSFIIYIVE